MTTIPIQHLDTVRDSHNADRVAVAHELTDRPGLFVAVFEAPYGLYSIMFDTDGHLEGETHVRRVDRARAAWDNLSYELRQILSCAARNGLKISAIKHFRAVTGLGLVDSKRAIECFTTSTPSGL